VAPVPISLLQSLASVQAVFDPREYAVASLFPRSPRRSADRQLKPSKPGRLRNSLLSSLFIRGEAVRPRSAAVEMRRHSLSSTPESPGRTIFSFLHVSGFCRSSTLDQDPPFSSPRPARAVAVPCLRWSELRYTFFFSSVVSFWCDPPFFLAY